MSHHKQLHETHHHKVHHDIRHTLEEQVKAAGMHERFISSEVERQLVTSAVGHGLDAGFAENVVSGMAIEKGFVLESNLDHIIGVILHHLGKKNKGKVDSTEFTEAIEMAKDLSHGVIAEMKLKKKAKQIMMDNGIHPESGGLLHHDWFKDI
jgi:hypothetical protein